MRVDEGREGVQPLGVDDLGPLGRVERAGRADLGDLAVADQHVAGLVEPDARVEQLGAADQDRGVGDRSAVEPPASGALEVAFSLLTRRVLLGRLVARQALAGVRPPPWPAVRSS